MKHKENETIGNFLYDLFLNEFAEAGTMDGEDREIFDYVLNKIKTEADSKRTSIAYGMAWIGFYLGLSVGMEFPEIINAIAAKEHHTEVTA